MGRPIPPGASTAVPSTNGKAPRCEPGRKRSCPASGEPSVRQMVSTADGQLMAWPPMPQSRCHGRSARPSAMSGRFHRTVTRSTASGSSGTFGARSSSEASTMRRIRGSSARARRPGRLAARNTRVSTSAPPESRPHQEVMSPGRASSASTAVLASIPATSSASKAPRTHR